MAGGRSRRSKDSASARRRVEMGKSS